MKSSPMSARFPGEQKQRGQCDSHAPVRVDANPGVAEAVHAQ
jgi:hypothetical protein